MIEIEKNIPLPKKRNRRVYPIDKMEVKDSFFIAVSNKKDIEVKRQNVYIAIWRFCKKYPEKKFTTASVEGGVRVWRIK